VVDWVPDLSRSDKPHYVAIADAIADDVSRGRLAPEDRLPPQRELALKLGVDFTTIARGYAEARRRGLVTARVGQGTFVAALPTRRRIPRTSPPENVDLSMNLPPEPQDPDLLGRMQEGLAAVGEDLVSFLRYQRFGGSEADKEAASIWLGRHGLIPNQERIFVTPGAHAAILGICGLLAKPGDVILSEALTYPGARSISAKLGLRVVGLPMDEDGVCAEAFADACQRHAPKLLYLNPTLLNPTTHTITEERRAALVEIARRFRVAIVEDDPYGLLPTSGGPPPFAVLAPDLTWFVGSLSKCLGAGLRVAYVVVPDTRSGWTFAASLRTATVMASPVTAALATRWILDGTADALLAAVRQESTERQRLAAAILPGGFRTHPAAFHLWLQLPDPWTRSAFVGHMRATGIGIVASDAFAADGPPPEAVRVCLGGPADRATVRTALEFMAHALAEAPEHASTFL
jgi:DNA-binding transcriptional MocR family regulator